MGRIRRKRTLQALGVFFESDGPRGCRVETDSFWDLPFRLDGDWGPQVHPLVPGHELLGTVTAVGALVTKFMIGDVVGVGPQALSCLTCNLCKKQSENYCSGILFTYGSKLANGYITKGGYAEYNRTHQRFVFKIPANLDKAGAAPLLCAGVTVFTPLKEAGVTWNTRVGVVGIGGLGHMAVKFANAMGATVTAISSSANKAEEARKLGAHHFILSSDDAQFKAADGTLDVLINTVSADLDWGKYLSLLAPRGTFVQLGAPPAPMQLQPFSLITRGIKVLGSLVGSPKDIEDMLELAGRHNIVCTVETFPFEKVNDCIAKLRTNSLRYRGVLVMPE